MRVFPVNWPGCFIAINYQYGFPPSGREIGQRFQLRDHDGYLPSFVHISNGKKHDTAIARKVPLAPYSIVAMDRGYNDYRLFVHWTDNQINFVTHSK